MKRCVKFRATENSEKVVAMDLELQSCLLALHWCPGSEHCPMGWVLPLLERGEIETMERHPLFDDVPFSQLTKHGQSTCIGRGKALGIEHVGGSRNEYN